MNEKNITQNLCKKLLEVYNYKSLAHTNFSNRTNIGEIVTVQEVLYKQDDINLNHPIVWSGQIGIILTACSEEKIEVIFLEKNMSELLYYSNHGTQVLEQKLQEIYNDDDELELHREVRIKIEKKSLLPLYAQQLELSSNIEDQNTLK